MCSAVTNVRFGPIADISKILFNHLVANQQPYNNIGQHWILSCYFDARCPHGFITSIWLWRWSQALSPRRGTDSHRRVKLLGSAEGPWIKVKNPEAPACAEKEVFIKFVMAITFRLWDRPYQCAWGMEAAMQKALFLAVLGTLLLVATIEVVAAGVKTSAVRSHFFAAAPAMESRSLCLRA